MWPGSIQSWKTCQAYPLGPHLLSSKESSADFHRIGTPVNQKILKIPVHWLNVSLKKLVILVILEVTVPVISVYHIFPQKQYRIYSIEITVRASWVRLPKVYKLHFGRNSDIFLTLLWWRVWLCQCLFCGHGKATIGKRVSCVNANNIDFLIWINLRFVDMISIPKLDLSLCCFLLRHEQN